MGQAMSGRRAEEAMDYENEIASKAWMGDPEAMQELQSLNPEKAMKIETQAAKRDETTYQRGVDKDVTFRDDMELVMDQIGAFPDFASAQGFGQRMTDIMAEKYPERWTQSGIPTEFDEAAFKEIQTIALGAAADRERSGATELATYTDPDTGESYPSRMQIFANPKTGATTKSWVTGDDGKPIRAITGHSADLQGAIAQAKAEGAAAGKIATLPDVTAAELSAEGMKNVTAARPKLERALSLAQQVRTHPGLKSAVGPGWYNPGKFVAGSEAHDFVLIAERLQGEAFSQAFETLKGGGQITEYEGKQATKALAQLSNAQSVEQFMAAIDDFERAMQRGFNAMVDQARIKTAADIDLSKVGEEGAAEAAAATVGGSKANAAKPTSKAEYDALPSGTWVTKPDGTTGKKP
jgi:hypothetical protein